MKLETSLNVLSLGLRSEYKIIRRWYFPYLSLDLLVNYFDETKINGSISEDFPFPNTVYRYSDDTRFGIGAGFGYQFDLFSRFSIDIHANYAILNLYGKKDKATFWGGKIKEKQIDTVNFSCSILYKIK